MALQKLILTQQNFGTTARTKARRDRYGGRNPGRERPADVPEESKFLLEFDPLSLSHSTPERKQYWVAAMEAALIAGRRRQQLPVRLSHQPARTSAHNSRAQRVNLYRIRRRHNRLLREIRENLDLHPGSGRIKRKRTHSTEVDNGSNKRFRKPD